MTHSIQVNVCAMKESSTDLFVRASTYFEVMVSKNADYHTVAEQAAKATNVSRPDGPVELVLLKLNGAVIANDGIPWGGCSRPWTVSNYFRLVVKKASSSVKIGVGYVKKTTPKLVRCATQYYSQVGHCINCCHAEQRNRFWAQKNGFWAGNIL